EEKSRAQPGRANRRSREPSVPEGLGAVLPPDCVNIAQRRERRRFSTIVTRLSLVAVAASAVGPPVGQAQAPSITFVQANAVVPQTPQSTVTVPFASAQ